MSAHTTWLTRNAGGRPVDFRRNADLSLTSKLGRVRVGRTFFAAPDPTAELGTQVGALADLVAWSIAEGADDAALVLAIAPQRKQAAVLSTLAAIGESLDQRWSLRLVELDDAGAEVGEGPPASDVGAHPNATRWAGYMVGWQQHQPEGLAAELVERMDDPRVTLHPRLSQPWGPRAKWQLRVEGLQVGTVGSGAGELWVGKDGKAGGQSSARGAWLASGGSTDRRKFSLDEVHDAEASIRAFVSGLERRGPFLQVLLDHGQPEHALESGILRNQIAVATPEGHPLSVPHDDPRVTWAGQIPTVWNDHTPRARYSDVLLADGTTPWVVELKVPGQAGGWGAYLRKGIHQCVLYRRFLRLAEPYDPWMRGTGLDHRLTEAALAFPDAGRDDHTVGLERLQKTAAAFGVPVVELDVRAPSPGSE